MAPKSLFGSFKRKPLPPPSRDDSPRRPEHVGTIFDRLNARRRSVSFSSAPVAMLRPHHGASVSSLPRVLATPPQLPQLQFSRAESEMMEAPLSPMSPQPNRAPEIVVSPPTAEETGRGKAAYEFFRVSTTSPPSNPHLRVAHIDFVSARFLRPAKKTTARPRTSASRSSSKLAARSSRISGPWAAFCESGSPKPT